MPDTLFYVGDNEVPLYLFDADMGTRTTRDDRLVLLDSGWPNPSRHLASGEPSQTHLLHEPDGVLYEHCSGLAFPSGRSLW